MKIIIAAIASTIIAGTAFAGEGDGNPFPFSEPGYTVKLDHYKQAPGGSTDPYPFKAPGNPKGANNVLEGGGSESPVQTANSLPQAYQGGNSGTGATQFARHTPVTLPQSSDPRPKPHG